MKKQAFLGIGNVIQSFTKEDVFTFELKDEMVKALKSLQDLEVESVIEVSVSGKTKM